MRHRRKYWVASLLSICVGACGAAPATTSTVEDGPPPAREAPPTTATSLVERLAAIASGASPGSIDAYVDHDFARRLPSGVDLASVFAERPAGCVPRWSEGPGGAAIAIPLPMMDDPPEEAARIESLQAELASTTEVMATCIVSEPDEDGATVDRELALYVIAVRADADGTLRALAWRDLQHEGGW